MARMRDKLFLAIAALALAAVVAEFAKGQTQIGPSQMKAAKAVVLACANATPASNCTGLYYIDIVTAAGTELKIMGAPATAPIDPAIWSVVP
jgi:hypothetical protein